MTNVVPQRKKSRRSSQIGRLGLECEFIGLEDKGSYSLYIVEIRCKANQSKWKIKKRYNDFYILDKDLQSDKNFRGIKLPELPPKSITLLDSSKKELSNQRIPKLAEYLKVLVARTVFLSSPNVREFLSMPSQVQDLALLLAQRQSTSIKEGWMEKKGKVNTTWKKRWFVVQPNYILKYYKEQNSNEPQGSIDISNIIQVSSKVHSDEKPHSFCLKEKNRVWWLACDNEQYKKEWVKVFMRLKDTKAPPKHGRIDTRKLSLNLGPHFKTITQIAWNPIIPGIIATGSEDETVKIWNTTLLDHTLIPDNNNNNNININAYEEENSYGDENNNQSPSQKQQELSHNMNFEPENEKNDEKMNENDNKKKEENEIIKDKEETEEEEVNETIAEEVEEKLISTYPLHPIEFRPMAEHKTQGEVTSLAWSPDGTLLVVSLRKDAQQNAKQQQEQYHEDENNAMTNFDINENSQYAYFIQCFDLAPVLSNLLQIDEEGYQESIGSDDDGDNNNKDNKDKDKDKDEIQQRTKIFTLQDHPKELIFSHDCTKIYMSMDIDPESEENEKRRPAFLVYLDLEQNQLHRCKTVDRIIDHQTEFIVGMAMNHERSIMMVATSTHQGQGRLIAWDVEKNETRLIERQGLRVYSMIWTEDDKWIIIARINGSVEFWHAINDTNNNNNNNIKPIPNDDNNSDDDPHNNVNQHQYSNDDEQDEKNNNKKNGKKMNDPYNESNLDDIDNEDEQSVEVDPQPQIPNFERKYVVHSHSGPVFNVTTSNGILITSAKPNNLDYETFFCDSVIWDIRNLINDHLAPKLIARLPNINEYEKDITRLLSLSPVTPRHVRQGGGPGTLLAASGHHHVYCHNTLDVLLDAINNPQN